MKTKLRWCWEVETERVRGIKPKVALSILSSTSQILRGSHSHSPPSKLELATTKKILSVKASSSLWKQMDYSSINWKQKYQHETLKIKSLKLKKKNTKVGISVKNLLGKETIYIKSSIYISKIVDMISSLWSKQNGNGSCDFDGMKFYFITLHEENGNKGHVRF